MATKIIDMREGMRFGMGVDSITEDVRGEALQFDAGVGSEGGQKAYPSVRMIESQESMMSAFNLSVSASIRYGLASLDAKLDMAQQHAVNEYSLYMLFKVSVENPPRSMRRPQLTEEAHKIYRRDPDEFRQIFGDMFIDEIYSGGEFFGLFIFNTRDESTRSEVAGEMKASIGNFLAGGEIQAAFKSTIENASRRTQMDIWAMMSGGSGLRNPRTLDELSELYANFNVSVRDHPIDYRASVKEFRLLPLPEGPPWVEQLVRRDTIESCGRNVVEAIKLRSKLDYILEHASQFVEPDLPVLQEKRRAISSLIPRWAQRAYDCSDDITQCSLEGLDPVTVETWPARLAIADPLDRKWEYIKQHDSRAAGYFSENFLGSGDDLSHYDEHKGGRYKLFYDQGHPMGGIFWNPRVNDEAFVVYGRIFEEYLRRGHCEGPLGYPRSDEETLELGIRVDGLDRVSSFEGGALWWDAQTNTVSDTLPPIPFDRRLSQDDRQRLRLKLVP